MEYRRSRWTGRDVGGSARARWLVPIASILFLLMTGWLSGDGQALAQGNPPAYPARPVRIVLGTPPGGAPDVFGRLIAQKMSENWGQVVVENRPGATGNLAAELVARAAPDGYTVYICDSTIWAINPYLFSRIPYDPLRDFTGVTTIADLPMFLTVHPSLPVSTYDEFLAHVKANPGRVAYSSAGNGSIHQITGELYKTMAGVDLVHVPYKGGGPAAQAVIAGEVPVSFMSYAATSGAVKAGRVRLLAITTARRTPALPGLPAIAELGLPGFDMSSLLGALVPAGTPREIINRLNVAMVAAILYPEVNARMVELGVNVRTSTPEAFTAAVRAEHARYERLVRSSGAQMD
jgi:tripartite-type tricarboxylate transporter receptor subunit TctC